MRSQLITLEQGVAAVQAGLGRLGDWDDRNLVMFSVGLLGDNTLNMRQ